MVINPNEVWSCNVEPLAIATYDGSGESTHPDVYDAGSGNTWNGHRYWMALTPYPNNDVTKENPCIYYSDDRVNWTGIAGNPIDSPDAKHRSDPDLFMDGVTLYCFYRAMNGTDDIMWQKSTDGTTWGSKTVEIEAPHSTLSPTIVKYGSEYQMYTVRYTVAGDNVMQKRTASDIEGAWSSPSTVASDHPNSGNFWHLNVINVSGVLYCLMYVNAAPTGYSGLYLGISTDGGDTWDFGNVPLLINRASDTSKWDHAEVYRSAFVNASNGFDLWYAGHDSVAGVYEWHIALSKIFAFDTASNLKHLYVLTQVNNASMTNYERTNFFNIAGKFGIDNNYPHIKPHSFAQDANTRLWESQYNTDLLAVDIMTEQIALLLGVAVGDITVTTTTPTYGSYTSTQHVFTVGGQDKATVIIFGTTAGTIAQSRDEAFGYVY